MSTKAGKKECDLCQRMFADSKCLKKHKQVCAKISLSMLKYVLVFRLSFQAVHSKLKPYICQVCNHQCARKAMLEMHARQHTGEKPYKSVHL